MNLSAYVNDAAYNTYKHKLVMSKQSPALVSIHTYM